MAETTDELARPLAADEPAAVARPTPRWLRSIKRRAGDWMWPVVGLLVGLVIWHIGATIWATRFPIATSFLPQRTFADAVRLVSTGVLWPHMAASLLRVGIGLALAVAIGVPVGLMIGYWRRLELGTSALFQFIRMISPLAWMPVAIMLFGVGDRPIYFLLTVAAVWPILINTATGVSHVDRQWIRAARALGANEWAVLRRVVIPSIIPDVLTGLRLAVGVAWLVLVPAEMLGVNNGLGYYILDTRDRFSYGELMTIILIIGVIGYTLDAIIQRLRYRFSWTLGIRDA